MELFTKSDIMVIGSLVPHHSRSHLRPARSFPDLPDSKTTTPIVAQIDGAITEIWWTPGEGVRVNPLPQFGPQPITAMSAYFTDDQWTHVIVAQGPLPGKPGLISEIRWAPDFGATVIPLGILGPNFPDREMIASAVAGYGDYTTLGSNRGLETAAR
jgi:hypothetical protein